MTGTFGNGASGASPPEVETEVRTSDLPARRPAFEKYFPKNAPSRRGRFKTHPPSSTKEKLIRLRGSLREAQQSNPRGARAPEETT